MTKFEYSDFYKFIASVGIALITLSALVTWLFLREPFDLLQRQDEINLLTPLAQSIIQNRQSTIQIILNLTPVFSITMFVLGLAASVIGGIMWLKRTQIPMERERELTIKALEKQLGKSSVEEAKVQREEEIKAQLEGEEEEKRDISIPKQEAPLTPLKINDLVEISYKIERRVTGLLVSCLAKTHTVMTERRLGPVTLDIVMPAKSSQYSDYIFEVKYIRRGFRYNWLQDNALKMVYANQLYQKETNRQATPVLFVVGADKTAIPSDSDRQKYLARIESELSKLDSKVIVVLLLETDLYNVDCKKMKMLLKLQAA